MKDTSNSSLVEKGQSDNNLPLFYQILENIPVAVFILEGLGYSYANPKMIEKLGYSWDELTGMNWWDPISPERRDEVREQGLARMRGEPAPEYYELKLITKSREIIWAEGFYKIFIFQGNQYTISGAYDITARKKAEDELQSIQQHLEQLVQRRTDDLQEANEELLRLNKNLTNIFENMSDGVIVVNENGEVEILNQVLQQAWGKALDEFEGHLREIVREGSNSYIFEMVDRQQPFRDVELIINTSQGDIHCLASGTPMKGEKGKPNYTIFFIRPIKEVRQLVNRFSGAWATFHFNDIISNSSQMDDVLRLGHAAAASLSNVLIQGESGTGKELLAQAIHNQSERRNGPFVALNCGAIPRELIGSELFGYAEGAFTGAKKGGNSGKFEMAAGGTLFLDEIGDMPLDQQVTLLRVLQEKKVSRIGGNRVIPVDVRFICATNKDLYEEMLNGNFRRDLFYRLNVIFILIPTLHERNADIPVLFFHFLKKKMEKQGLQQPTVPTEVIELLLRYNWPGNVRELENAVERLIYACPNGDIGVEHLPREIREYGKEKIGLTDEIHYLPAENHQIMLSSRQKLDELERDELLHLLHKYDGNIAKIARHLSVSRNTVYTRMKKYRIIWERK